MMCMIQNGSKVRIIGQEFYGKIAKVLLVNKDFNNVLVYGEGFRYLANIKDVEEIR